jgi:hypothetical protein
MPVRAGPRARWSRSILGAHSRNCRAIVLALVPASFWWLRYGVWIDLATPSWGVSDTVDAGDSRFGAAAGAAHHHGRHGAQSLH